jgi:hypothetical protein
MWKFWYLSDADKPVEAGAEVVKKYGGEKEGKAQLGFSGRIGYGNAHRLNVSVGS